MSILIQYEDTEILDFDPEFFVSWLSEVCKKEGKELVEVALVFCSDDYLLDVNRKYLDHDYYTDIITFDYVEGDRIIGDLLISVDRVRDNAESAGIDFTVELNRVVVHGVLHLLGYKDKSEADQIKMREREDYYLGFT